MKSLVNVPLGVRVFGAFGLVLFVTLALGLFSIVELAVVNRASDALGGEAMPSLHDSGQLLASVINFRREEANRILSVTPEDGSYREQRMAFYADQIAALRKDYEPLITVERDEISQFDGLWPQYLSSTQDIVRKLQAGQKDAAHEGYVGENRKQFDALNILLTKATQLNQQAGENSYDLLRQAARTARIGVIVALCIAVGVALALGYFTVATTATPIRRLTAVMGRLSSRDLSADVPDAVRRDEVGAMARAVEVFKRGLIEAERLAEAQRTEERAKSERAARIDELIAAFDARSSEALKSFGVSAGQLDETAQRMAAVAEETERQSTAVAATATQMSGNIGNVAATTGEMASGIAEISGQVVHAKDVADRAEADVRRSGETVASLAEATDKIGAVITLIQAIAAQTNLLALNATIEAARAGEVGKGFAVVAAEVKNLANETAKATEEISLQISAVQRVSGEAVDAIRAIGRSIGEVNEISAAIATAMAQQDASTGAISHNVAQVASGTQEMAGAMAEVTAAAGQSGSAAIQVLSAARDLAGQSGSLQKEVARFLAAIQAA